MNIKQLGDHIVVKVLEEEQVTASGIVLPDTVDKEKKAQGSVIAIGPGKMLENGSRAAMDVAVGQIVLFKNGAATKSRWMASSTNYQCRGCPRGHGEIRVALHSIFYFSRPGRDPARWRWLFSNNIWQNKLNTVTRHDTRWSRA